MPYPLENMTVPDFTIQETNKPKPVPAENKPSTPRKSKINGTDNLPSADPADPVELFEQHMSRMGLSCPEPIIPDGLIHRFQVPGDKRGEVSSWYWLNIGTKTPHGCCGSWRGGLKSFPWCNRPSGKMSPSERRAFKQVLAQAEATRQQDKTVRAEEARERLRYIWDKAALSKGKHPYLKAKQVPAYGLREYRGSLVIPMCDSSGEVLSLQFIGWDYTKAESTKRFLAGLSTKGLHHLIGKLESTEVIYIAEGYCTGASIHVVTEQPVAVGFDCGNLLPVAQAVREAHPEIPIVIAADNDQWTEGNPGITKAREAARAVDGKMVYPTFQDTASKPTDFNDLLTLEGPEAVLRQLEGGAKAPAQETGNDDDLGIPNWFTVTSTGVYWDEPNSEEPPTWVCSPGLYVKAQTRDDSNRNHGQLLEFKDRLGNSHSLPLPLELLSGDSEQLRKELLSHGLLLSTSRKGKQALITYLMQCSPRVTALCTGRTGWYRNVFVLPEEVIGQVQGEQVLYQSDSLTRNPYTTQGTLQQWQTHVAALCVGNSRLTLSVSCGFAAPLLSPFHLESSGFHLTGPSSLGKTTAARVAASVWGPCDYVKTWRSTSNGLESTAASHSDTFLVLDELSEVSPHEAGICSYMLSNGMGKQRASRSGGARPRQTWRLVFLSTGELDLASHMSSAGRRATAGQTVRVVNIPAQANPALGIFEDIHDRKTPADFANELRHNVQVYYGVASRAYLAELVEADPLELLEEFKIFNKKFFHDVVPKGVSGQVERVGTRFSLVGFAGELAGQFKVTGWKKGVALDAAKTCFNVWLESRGTTGNQEELDLLRQVKLFFELHGESRFSKFDSKESCYEIRNETFKQDYDRETKTYNRAGYRRSDEFLVFTGVFREELCKGFDYKQAAKILVKHGILKPDKGGKSSQNIRNPEGGQKRFYVFDADKLEGRGE